MEIVRTVPRLIRRLLTLDLLNLVSFSHFSFQGAPSERAFAPGDPYRNATYWPNGFGQLTDRGRNRMFEVGQFLRERYAHFLTDDLGEVSVRSSAIDRCQETGQWVVSGAYRANNRTNELRSVPVQIDKVANAHWASFQKFQPSFTPAHSTSGSFVFLVSRKCLCLAPVRTSKVKKSEFSRWTKLNRWKSIIRCIQMAILAALFFSYTRESHYLLNTEFLTGRFYLAPNSGPVRLSDAQERS